jgi:hypothetical protein
LYLAESPDVAKSYATKVSDEEIFKRFWSALDNAGDGYIGVRGDDSIIKNSFRKSWNSPDGVRTTRLPGTSVIGVGYDNITEAKLMDAIKKSNRYGENVYLLEGNSPSWIQHLANDPGERLLSDNKILSSSINKNSLYKVDLPENAIAKMLDYDNPVSDAFRKPLSDAAMNQFGTGLTGTSGEKLYKDVIFNFKQAGHPNPTQAATDWLTQQGVPGMKYLDGGSRGAGAGTSNYVVFPGNESLLRILERNGVKP